MELTHVYVDGACFPNPGQGGWAWTTLKGEYDSGHMPRTTNNVMELRAPIEAIKSLYQYERPLMIYSDSQYVVKGITEWVHAWIERDWKTKKTGPVKNVELWMELYELVNGHSIFFKWVKGHSGNAGNDEADRLSTVASRASQELIRKCNQFYLKSSSWRGDHGTPGGRPKANQDAQDGFLKGSRSMRKMDIS